MAVSPLSVFKFSTDKDVDFAENIVQNGVSTTSLAFPTDLSTTGFQKLMITSVSIILDHATTALDLDVSFFGDSNFTHASDIDLDKMIQTLRFEAADAKESTATDIYYYETQADMNMPIDYCDEENRSRLHVSLINRSATTFDFGTADRVKLTFTAEPVI